MAWFFLFIAGVMEITWVLGMKFSEGFSRLWPSIMTVIAMTFSMYFLSRAIKVIPIGTGYAVWTGIGAAGTAIIGMLYFDESRSFLRMICIVCIVFGIVGLKVFSK